MTEQNLLVQPRRFFSLILPFAVCLFSLLSAAPVFAQLQIVSRAPRLDDIHATAFTDIRIGFDRALNASSPAAAIQVWGNFHGRYAGTLGYADANQTLVFTPSQSFVDGEEITVVLTTAIRGADNTLLSQPYIWRFLVRTNYGSGNFEQRPYDLESASPLAGINQEPTHLVPGDFNNDDFIDLAVVHHGANRITVLRNTVRQTAGRTLFTPVTTLTTGNTPVHAVAVDFNNDNRLDLAVVNFNGNSFQIFTGSGNGQFGAPQTINTGSRPIHLLAQDFNGDGAVDLAVTLFGADRVDIFLNNGAGGFSATASQQLLVGFGPVAAAAWDYDQNGALDIIVANHGAKSLSPLFNSGRGSFIAGSSLALSIPPVDLVSGDIAGVTGNQVGDGRREIVALCSDLNLLGKTAPSQLATSQLAIVNFASNRLNLVETVTLPGYAQALTLCNVDTLDLQRGTSSLRPDRDLDIFYTRFRDDRVSALRNPDNQPFVNLTPTDLDTVTSAKAITHLDIDRDGDNDLVVGNYLENQLVIYLNRGRPAPPCTPVDSLGTSVPLVDFGDVCVRRTTTRRLFLVNSSSLPFSFTTLLTDSITFGISPRRGTVPANRAFPITVTFTPGDTLPYQSNLLITTSDGTTTPNSCSMILRGRGVRASLAVDQLLDFGCIPPQQTVLRQLRLQNTGNIPLVLSGATNSLPLIFVVRASLINQQIPPRSFIDVPIAFTPDRVGNFLDSLRIAGSNNCDQPVTTVLLRGCGSISGPTITSNDTLYATEDVLATYIATATDPDGTTPTFRFQNLPSWLRQTSANTVQGTAREGYPDTTFMVIASDGVLEARLQVKVIVIRVNDAPVFDPITDKTVIAGNLLAFDVVARDPENDVFTLSAQNLPTDATFPQATTAGRGQFLWRPSLSAVGQYAVTFSAREQNTAPPLSSSLTVRITVLTRLPDLYIAKFEMATTPVRLNQRVMITATFADSSAPAQPDFIARLQVDNQTPIDTAITSLQPGARITFSRPVQFSSLGRHSVQSVIDVDDVIAEVNESNNSQRLEFDVLPGQLNVAPNPFTPNNDGFNDAVTFGFGNVGVQSPQLKIFDLHGNLLKTISSSQTAQLQWDGNDNSGRAQPPGPYLYLFLDGSQKIASGYIVLAR